MNILNDFADWEFGGPVLSFARLRDDLFGAAKYCFDKNKIFVY